MPNNNNNNNNSGGGIGPAGLGMLQGAFNMLGAGQQHRRQRELMDIQYQNQRNLNQQGHQLQMDMWNRTNYGAQVEHMKKAGLSPGLMYGMSGGGGTTAGSQGGGSASGGNAVQMHPMDMANLSLIDAERKLKEAQARELDARTDKAGSDIKVNEQNILESIARSGNISEDNKLKAEQKLKTISDRKLVESQERLNELKEGKGVTGSAINDMMNNLGLDPTNNEADKWIVRGMLIAHFGIENITKIARMFPKVVEEQFMRWFFPK